MQERKKKTDQLRALTSDTPSDNYQPKSPQKENKFSPKRKVRSPHRLSQGSPLEVHTIAVESTAKDLTQKLDVIKAAENRPK